MKTDNNRNFILAIALSMAVLFGWQFFIAGPEIERARQQQELAQSQAQDSAAQAPANSTAGAPAAVFLGRSARFPGAPALFRRCSISARTKAGKGSSGAGQAAARAVGRPRRRAQLPGDGAARHSRPLSAC